MCLIRGSAAGEPHAPDEVREFASRKVLRDLLAGSARGGGARTAKQSMLSLTLVRQLCVLLHHIPSIFAAPQPHLPPVRAQTRDRDPQKRSRVDVRTSQEQPTRDPPARSIRTSRQDAGQWYACADTAYVPAVPGNTTECLTQRCDGEDRLCTANPWNNTSPGKAL